MAPIRPAHPLSNRKGGVMPGKQPLRAPPPTMTGELQLCPAVHVMGDSSYPSDEDRGTSRTVEALREADIGAQAVQPAKTREVEPKALLPRTQSLSSPEKSESPQALPGMGQVQTHTRRPGRLGESPQQLYSLSIVGSRDRPVLENTTEGLQCEDPQFPDAGDARRPGSRTQLRPHLPGPEAPPGPEELNFQRCFQEPPSSFTSTNYTSPSTTPGPPPLRAPPSGGTSPCRPASYLEFQASGADSWTPTAENSFPGASFGMSPAEPESFPDGSNSGVVSFEYPFPALHGASPKPFPKDTARHGYTQGTLVFAFHQPPGTWPAPPLPPCYPPGDLNRALPEVGAAPPPPNHFSGSRPTFPESLHKNLSKRLPEIPPSAHDRLGTPQGPPNSLPQRHFPRASRVGTNPKSLDTELAAPGPLPTQLPQLWDSTTAPYPTPALGPSATTRGMFFESQLNPDQQLSLPQSPPIPWSQGMPAAAPSTHHPMEMLSQLPFSPEVSEWQEGSQGALGTTGPGEKLMMLRTSPSQHGSPPGLFPYNGSKDPGTQTLFFGVAQPQVSPRGPTGLPPPQGVAASPSESPLPSPATNTAGGSTCSSLSPPSCSPANPSSEDSQLSGPLGAPAFFHPSTHHQEASNSFPSPEPPHLHGLPIHHQPEPVKAFPFSTNGMGAKDTFKCLEEAPYPDTGTRVSQGALEGFPREPPPYPDHHFPLSSASLDQLDVLLTCKQCDRNYSSLATFLEHRHFCGLLLAWPRDGPTQSPGPPTPPTTPKAAARGSPSLLQHTRTVPLLLGGDPQTNGKDDPLKPGLLPSLAIVPFTLPAADLDLEDEAKLDSLITEALKGLEYQSDTPEIDSSFIDVFTDEEPSGPRSQAPKTRLGALPENKAPPRPHAEATTQASHPENQVSPARSRPQTRSLGPVDINGLGLERQQRRGKRFKLLQKELDTVRTTQMPGRGSRVSRLRPRRKGPQAKQPQRHARELRTQNPKSHPNPGHQTPSTETRSSKRLRRLASGREPCRRRTRGGTWSKELIHKILQQKNQRHQHGPSLCLSLDPEQPAKDQAQDHNSASESEEDENLWTQGPGFRGRPRQGCRRRWRRGEKKKKEVGLPLGLPQMKKGQKTRRQGARKDGDSLNPEELSRPDPGPSQRSEALPPTGSPEARADSGERGPQDADCSLVPSKHLEQVPTCTKIPEGNHPPRNSPQKTVFPETAEEFPPDTPKLCREVLSSSPPATCVGGSACPPGSMGPQPGREDTKESIGSSEAPDVSSQPSFPVSQHREDTPECPSEELAVPAVHATSTAHPDPCTLFSMSLNLGCDPPVFCGGSMGAPVTKKEPLSYSRTPRKLFSGPKDLAGCFHQDLYSQSGTPDPPPANHEHLCQDSELPRPFQPTSPQNSSTVDTDPDRVDLPLTLESMPLFPGLPKDGFNLTGDGDTHFPFTGGSPPRKPHLDPPCSPFLPDKGWALLEDVSPVLPSHFPNPSGEMDLHGKCPSERTRASCPSPLPGRVSPCDINLVSGLSEHELEIKKLVTELESQLQTSKDVSQVPKQSGAEQADAPLPVAQATSPARTPSVPLNNLEGLSPLSEGADTTVVTMQSSGSPQQWAPLHPEAALSPSVASRARDPEAEEGCGICPSICLSIPGKLLLSPVDMSSSAKCSPNQEGREHAKADFSQPCQDSPALEAFSSPAVHPTPDLVFQGVRGLSLDSPSLSDAHHNKVPQGPSVSHAGGSKEGSSEGQEELALLEVSPSPAPQGMEVGIQSVLSPACVHNSSPGREHQHPGASPLHQLQLLVARAAEEKEPQSPQGSSHTSTWTSQHSSLSDMDRDSEENEKRAESPAQGFQGHVQVAAGSAETTQQLRPEAEGHLDLPEQMEEPMGQGRANQLQQNWVNPGGADHLSTITANPEAILTKPAECAGQPERQLQGGRTVLGLGEKATPSPTSSSRESSMPCLGASHAQDRLEGRAPDKVTSPNLEKHLLFSWANSAPLLLGQGSGLPSPTSEVTPIPCSLKQQLPEDHPHSWGHPDSPLHLPASSPAWTPQKRVCHTQDPTDAGAEGDPEISPFFTTSPGGLKGSLASPLLCDSSPLEDLPKCQPVLVGEHPEDSMYRAIEDSRRERPRSSPSRTSSLTMEDTAPPSIPAIDDMEAVRNPGASQSDPDCRGAPLHSGPNEMRKAPSSDPPSNNVCLGHREGPSVTAVPYDSSTSGPKGPDACLCSSGEAATSLQRQETVEKPRSGHSDTRALKAGPRGLSATDPSTELHQGRVTSPQDSSPNTPESFRHSHQTHKEDPFKPDDVKKQLASTGNSLQKKQAPSRWPNICEVCSASFRSSPGLSRHRARKHRIHQRAASQPRETPRKKCRRAPVKKSKQSSMELLDTQRPKVSQGSRRRPRILGTADCVPSQELHTPDLVRQGVDVKPAELRKADRLEKKELCSKEAERGSQRQGRGQASFPGELKRKSNPRARKLRARRFQEESSPPVSPDVISDRSSSNPSTVMACPLGPLELGQEAGVTLPPHINTGSRVTVEEAAVGTDPEVVAPKSPRDWVAHPKKVAGAPQKKKPKAQKTDLAKGSVVQRESRTKVISEDQTQKVRMFSAGDNEVARNSCSRQGIWGVPEPSLDSSDPPETCSSEPGSRRRSSCSEDKAQKLQSTPQESPNSDLGDRESIFDDEASFSQLFPLGTRLTRKKNPRVYGKRHKKPKPPPPPELFFEVEGSAPLSPTHLATDLSDSGSLCLSHEDPWGEEATGLPQSFLLDDFFSSKVPGIDPWAPSPNLWALETNPRAERPISPCTQDHLAENIPELHMVPAAWRGLDLRAPTEELPSSLRDESPEPPDLEREGYAEGLPGGAMDLQALEMQDLCFLGACEEDAPIALPSLSFLDLKTTASSLGPQEPKEAAGARRSPQARRGSHKCRVCFRRFGGLGELDVHLLVHSPSPPPTCYLCVQRHFGSRERLQEHLRQKHLQGRQGPWACGMCLQEVADIWMYNEHLREHAVRFARRGLARRSLRDSSHGWEGDCAVTDFLSSLLGAAPRPHPDQSSSGQGEASGPEPEAQREFPGERAAPSDAPHEGSPPTVPSPDSLSEPLDPSVAMHQDCRDPSRDCHHCGKRFPKPFKLQRHLAVHSPQRVYLCPLCPRVYSELSELRTHLGEAHRDHTERELPQTPLFTCELCAAVTHISRRSFACSTCNYTFAKKEQFDRHMAKHRRRGHKPCPVRRVHRPRGPQHQAPPMPSKRCKVAVSSGPPLLSQCGGPIVVEGTPAALLQSCPEVVSGTPKGQLGTPEKPRDRMGNPDHKADLQVELQELLPPPLSPFPATSMDSKGYQQLNEVPESSENETSTGGPQPVLQQAPSLEEPLPQPGTIGLRGQERGSAGLPSRKRRTPSDPGKGVPSLLRKEKQVFTCRVAPEGETGASSHKSNATKPGGFQSLSKDKWTWPISSKAPKFPAQPRKSTGNPVPTEPAPSAEDQVKPTTLKVKPGSSSQGGGGPQHGTQRAGGSQPQLASGPLQSETATTPAKPDGPSQNPKPDKLLPQAPAKSYPRGPREAGDQGNLGSREDREANGKRKGRAQGPTKSEAGGNMGRASSAPEKPTRAPRKQATPSRVIPKPRPNSHSSRIPLRPSEQGKREPALAHGDCRPGGLGKAFPQARPLHKPTKRCGVVPGASPTIPHACQTVESQNHLLSQLFGQRLTGFKIPLKKDTSE
ncbi:zinc finger protein 469 [Erinaceus europaeus]|uniref:Zinc finger protein 469 n=1 Tax=Erinaceus europaeus TaxID=9365 RepID=A0ABM3WWR0_ERIEU|nr:zinc finger protein 469 [Erinaceus europaeus]XP_060041010.1 zinc finger protein 469 [Erinaceus europaeus]